MNSFHGKDDGTSATTYPKMKTRNSPSYFMIFDTETTGLPLNKTKYNQSKAPEEFNLKSDLDLMVKNSINSHKKRLNQIYDFSVPEKYPFHHNIVYGTDTQPYMIQLSYVILKKNSGEYSPPTIEFHYNEFIRLPEGETISEFITNINGITQEMSDNGVNIIDALHTFTHWFLKCDSIIGHNIKFDSTIIRIELQRHENILKMHYPYINIVFNEVYDQTQRIDYFDTMIRGNKICGIMIPKKDGNGLKLKLPKLVEMYDVLFHRTAQHFHNSMVDVLVTMRCYLKLKYHKDVDDLYFEDLLKKAVERGELNGVIVYESYGESICESAL